MCDVPDNPPIPTIEEMWKKLENQLRGQEVADHTIYAYRCFYLLGIRDLEHIRHLCGHHDDEEKAIEMYENSVDEATALLASYTVERLHKLFRDLIGEVQVIAEQNAPSTDTKH